MTHAYLALLSNDDPVTSYGVELHVSNLATTPSSERAIITVRASNGREITFEATEAHRDCLPEGTVFWGGPDAKALAAAGLGQAPFSYGVELILDGVHYVATATWPDDEIKGEEPAVRLAFSRLCRPSRGAEQSIAIVTLLSSRAIRKWLQQAKPWEVRGRYSNLQGDLKNLRYLLKEGLR